MGGISIWQLMIIMLIVVLLFGTNKLRNVGHDLGSALRGFRRGLDEGKESVNDALGNSVKELNRDGVSGEMDAPESVHRQK